MWYIHGHLPVFHHGEEDVRIFRMFTSQMIINGTVKPKEIVKAFSVPSITVKRYVKVFREHGVEGFYETKTRLSSASVLKGEVLERARALLEQGWSVPRVSSELKVLANTPAGHDVTRLLDIPKARRSWASSNMSRSSK